MTNFALHVWRALTNYTVILTFPLIAVIGIVFMLLYGGAERQNTIKLLLGKEFLWNV